MELSAQLAQPLLALLGTIVVAGLAFYQWRKQHSDPKRTAAAEASRSAHERLWQQLEDVQLRLREAQSDAGGNASSALLKEVNIFFLRNSLYFDEKDQVLVNDYVKALTELNAVMAQADEDTRRDWQNSVAVWSHSIPGPTSVVLAPEQVQGEISPTPDLAAVKARVASLRAKLKRKLRLGSGLGR